MEISSSNLRSVKRNALLALAYFATGWLGLQLPYAGTHITLVWLPTGIALAGLLRCGQSVWPGVALGALLVNLAIGSPLSLALGITVGNTLAPLLAAEMLRRAGFDRRFSRSRDVALLLAAAALGMTVSASIGASSLFLAGLMQPDAVMTDWLAWWMGDSVGVLLAAPLLLTATWKSLARIRQMRGEIAAWSILALFACWFIFVHNDPRTAQPLPLAFLSLPPLIWAAMRFGYTGSAIAGLLFSVAAAWGTAEARGPFALADTHLGMVLLWGYMATLVLTGLLITALQAERLRAENASQLKEEKLRGLFELCPLGIALTDMDGRFVRFNEAFREICGYPADELMQLDYWALTPRKYEADEARQLESLRRTGRYGPYEKEYVRKDGRPVPLRLNGMLIRDRDGHDYIWSIVEDITDRQRIEADLRIAARVFDSQEGMVITDARGVILRVNRAFTETTGYSAEEAIGQTPRLLKSGRHNEDFYHAMWDTIGRNGSWQGEVWDRRKNGEIYPKWLTISAVKNDAGEVTHYVGTHFDITERKLAEERIRELAFFDQLTGLPNRTLLIDRLKQAITASTRSGKYAALLFIDLDNFKTLNDTLGHDTGDMLLRQVATRLTAGIRAGDTVARLGGDEFVIVLTELRQQEADAAHDTELIAGKILATLAAPYDLGGANHRITASIGATLFMDHRVSVELLMKQADMAMYRAKAAGRNALRFFDPDMESAVIQRVALEADLRHAIDQRQFVIHLQAQVAASGLVTGAEALVRWQHPTHGLVPPAEFIPLAEECGTILPLGHWVLESTCDCLARWAGDPALAPLTIAVNVSAHQIHQPGFVDEVLAVIAQSGANPQRLKLELTESLLVDSIDAVTEKMLALQAHGIGFSLDDFGTGYSSLAYLKRLPLDQLKIDRSFVNDVLTDANDAAIARTIVLLAQSLELDAIAEGVETVAQRDFLASAGCTAYQGFLFARPLPIEEFEAYARRVGTAANAIPNAPGLALPARP